MKFGILIRTIGHLKPIQVWNRMVRRFASRHTDGSVYDICRIHPQVSFLTSENLCHGNCFTFLNETRSVSFATDWSRVDWPKLWLYNLHYFEWLRPMSHDIAQKWISRWINENPVGYGIGWEPYPVSLRLVNWIKWSLLETNLAESEFNSFSFAFRESLCKQVRWLSHRLEYHLLANHLLANAKALLFAGVFFAGNAEADSWRRKGLSIYKHELPEQILDDGIHFERSAMYHSIILEDLLDCCNLLASSSDVTDVAADLRFFRHFAERMLVGLDLLTGPSGEITKFNDATDGIAHSPAQLHDYARALGITSISPTENSEAVVRRSGFVRMTAADYVLMVKTGDIGPSYQPGHAHADTFSFELWKGLHKLVTDTGCSTYEQGSVRTYERSSAAHNVAIVDGINSSETWASHRVGRRPQLLPSNKSCWRYQDARGFTISRSLILSADGLRGMDEISGKGEHDVEIRWHFPDEIAPNILRLESGDVLEWEECSIAVGWNLRYPGKCAVFRKRLKLPIAISWVISGT